MIVFSFFIAFLAKMTYNPVSYKCNGNDVFSFKSLTYRQFNDDYEKAAVDNLSAVTVMVTPFSNNLSDKMVISYRIWLSR